MGPKISEVRVRAVRVPMREPHRTASGAVSESPLVLIDAITDDGIAGHGIVFTYTATALEPMATLTRNIAPLAIGRALDPAGISDSLAKRFRMLGTQGLVGMALAGIDMALWDARARTEGVSLARLLGAEPKPLMAYGAVGYDGAVESARAAEEWARRGFKGVKAKVGYPDASQDIETIRAIRSAVGPDVAIMIDYNQSLTPEEAIRRLRVIEAEGLAWAEEPTLAHDYRGHAAIAQAIATPIQCGENWWGLLDLGHAIEAHASDCVMFDAMKIGGITGWTRGAAIAAANKLPVSTHLWPELSAQLMCATPTAHWLEYADWWNPILADPLHVRDGMAIPGDAPGSGVEWNEEAVAQYPI